MAWRDGIASTFALFTPRLSSSSLLCIDLPQYVACCDLECMRSDIWRHDRDVCSAETATVCADILVGHTRSAQWAVCFLYLLCIKPDREVTCIIGHLMYLLQECSKETCTRFTVSVMQHAMALYDTLFCCIDTSSMRYIEDWVQAVQRVPQYIMLCYMHMWSQYAAHVQEHHWKASHYVKHCRSRMY